MANYSTTNVRTINTSFATWDGGNKIPKVKALIANSSAIYYPAVTVVNTTTYYFMRALDPDCLPTVTYRYWTVTGTPDTTGALYVGARCGATPLSNIVVTGKLTV